MKYVLVESQNGRRWWHPFDDRKSAEEWVAEQTDLHKDNQETYIII
jgi:hypothetical protein